MNPDGNDRLLAAVMLAVSTRIYPRLTALKVLFLGERERLAAFTHQLSSPAHAFARDERELAPVLDRLHEHDIIVSRLDPLLPVLGKGRIELALRARRRKPMLLVDLGPRPSIEPQAGTLEDVFLYSAEDLWKLAGGAGSLRPSTASYRRPTVSSQAASPSSNRNENGLACSRASGEAPSA